MCGSFLDQQHLPLIYNITFAQIIPCLDLLDGRAIRDGNAPQ